MNKSEMIDIVAYAIPYRGNIRCNENIRKRIAEALIDLEIRPVEGFKIDRDASVMALIKGDISSLPILCPKNLKEK